MPIVAALAGFCLTFVALYGVCMVLLAGGLAAEGPDPCDGDFFDAPDTWSEVAQYAGGAVALAFGAGVAAAAAGALFRWAASGRWPAARRVAMIPPVCAAVVAALIGAALAPQAHHPVPRGGDCSPQERFD